MARQPGTPPATTRRMRGFEPAFGFVKAPVKAASEARGFAEARLLTHWAEIAGEDMARITRPVKVGYDRKGFGAVLTLLTTGAVAPMVEMQKEKLRERVNAVYGYAAIARIAVTQTAASGFAEGQAQFMPAPVTMATPDPAITAQAAALAAPVQDDGLRQALQSLTQNFLTRRKATEGSKA